jgi:hypothetical protein
MCSKEITHSFVITTWFNGCLEQTHSFLHIKHTKRALVPPRMQQAPQVKTLAKACKLVHEFAGPSSPGVTSNPHRVDHAAVDVSAHP